MLTASTYAVVACKLDLFIVREITVVLSACTVVSIPPPVCPTRGIRSPVGAVPETNFCYGGKQTK